MSNTYEKKARKQSLLGSINETAETKNNIKGTLAQTGLDLLIGGLAGSFVGHITGRWSLLGGAAVTGTSYYLGSRLAASFGVGMMSAGFVKVVSGTDGLNGATMDTVKERSKVFFEGLKARLFLDKVLKKKPETPAANPTDTPPVSGLGNVRYFMYPPEGSQVSGPGDLDMSTLNRLEEQIAESARQYQAEQKREEPHQVSGLSGSLGELMDERIM